MDKLKIIKELGIDSSNTGCAEYQITSLTEEIATLTEHLKVHRKDHHSERGLMVKLGKRKSLVSYLEKISTERAKAVKEKLGIRKR